MDSIGESNLTCERCRTQLPELAAVDALTRSLVGQHIRVHDSLEAMRELVRSSRFNLRQAKAVVMHVVQELGRCRRCSGEVGQGPFGVCPKCRSVNLSW